MVYLAGSAHQNTGTANLITVLPKAARPKHVMFLSIYNFDASVGVLIIEPNGDVMSDEPAGRQFTSLAGISFPVAKTTWHKVSLTEGWKSAQSLYNTGDSSYAVIGGVVYLSGSVRQPSGTVALFGTLPKAERPANVLELATYTFDGAFGSLGVASNGWTFAVSTPDSSAQAYTSLAAISYPRGA